MNQLQTQGQQGRRVAALETQESGYVYGDRLSRTLALFMALPGLRGFWPLSAFDSSGNAHELSAGRDLTYNGNPTYNYTTGGAGYLTLDGTGDYLARADEAALDILGSESYITSAKRGLTLGGWYRFSSVGTTTRVMLSKWIDPNNRAYILNLTSGPYLQFNVSNDGSADNAVSDSVARSVNTWYFVAGRFTPSTNVELFVNDTTYARGSGPASLYNSSADLRVGVLGDGTLPMTGDIALQFLCATALSDALLGALYQQSRALFGV